MAGKRARIAIRRRGLIIEGIDLGFMEIERLELRDDFFAKIAELIKPHAMKEDENKGGLKIGEGTPFVIDLRKMKPGSIKVRPEDVSIVGIKSPVEPTYIPDRKRRKRTIEEILGDRGD